MPNWIEGSLRTKGKYEDVLCFYKEGLNCYDYSWRGSTQIVNGDYPKPRIKPKEEWLIIDEDHFDVDGREVRTAWIDILDREDWAYVEGTRRAFIPGRIETHIREDKNGSAVGCGPVRQAWGFMPEDWAKLSEKYHIDIRLFGVESGMEFQEYVEIINGEVIQNDVRIFDNFVWDCVFPWMGG